MFNYGSLQTTNPLTPQASIQLHNPSNNSQNCEANAIVDTGAVMTCIPEAEIKKLGRALRYSTIQMRDANGNVQVRKTYWISIRIAEHEYEELEVIAITKKYALIGRDILNQHKLVLNAPKKKWGLGCNESICPNHGSK